MSVEDEIVRSQRRTLPILQDGSWCPLLTVQLRQDGWRIVEVFSADGHPFEVALQWSSAGATGAQVEVTVATGTRICVFARTLILRARNLATVPHTVVSTVSDGFAMTENCLELRGQTVSLQRVPIGIPSFARRVRVELGTWNGATGARYQLVDGGGRISSSISVRTQPQEGVWVGGAERLELWTPVASEYRVLFTLCL